MAIKAKKKIGFNKTIIRDGCIVVLHKNGTEKFRKDRVTGEIIKDKNDRSKN